MKYSKGDMVKMRIPEREILDSPVYTKRMIEIFKTNPEVKILSSGERAYGIMYYIEDWRGVSRAIRGDWIAGNRGPVLFI